MTVRQYYYSFSTVLRRLKKLLPPVHPVSCRRIRFTKGSVNTAECWLANRKFYIRLERRLGNDAAIDTLLHEWAHILLWTPNNALNLDDHGPEWGLAYSRVWQMFEKEFVHADEQEETEA